MRTNLGRVKHLQLLMGFLSEVGVSCGTAESTGGDRRGLWPCILCGHMNGNKNSKVQLRGLWREKME